MQEQNIAEVIREAKGPTGEMADLAGKAQRLSKALKVAEKWMEVSTSDTEMFGRALIARDQLEEELSRTVFAMDVIDTKRVIAEGRRRRQASLGEVVSEEDLHRESRESTLSDWLLYAYTTLGAAPLEVFELGDRAAEERTRYAMMGALIVAADAASEAATDEGQKPAGA